jgi:PAS domain S-box-containing protein
MIPSIAVILTDPARRILWVNEDFCHITGYAPAEAIGKVPGALLQGPKTEQEAVNRIRKGLNQKISLREQLTNYRKNGEPYLCRLVIHPVFDAKHELTNFIAFEIDATHATDDLQIPLLEFPDRYRTSSLKGIEETLLYEKLCHLLEAERLFLNPDLTLRKMADKLATNTKYLSQVINHQTGLNFQQFINKYRVEEAKAKITDKALRHLTLYGVALQCGFKNKSTFYKVFKEVTQLTPREFILSK